MAENEPVPVEDKGDEQDDGLYIQIRGTKTKLEVDPASFTMDKVMEEIASKKQIPVENQIFINKDGETLKIGKGTLSSQNINSGDTIELKHRLKATWTMWYDTPDPTKKPDPNNWHANMKQIKTFDTVEDFWRLFNNMNTPSELKLQSNYHLFKEGIMPAWEDPQNAKGGKWVLQLNTTAAEKKLLDELWLFTILEMIGEGFDDCAEICGIVVSLRKSRNRIAIWTRTANNAEAMKRLGTQFKEKMNLGARHKVSFTKHDQAAVRGAKSMYEV